mgnify:CR=1 FL=1
MTDEEKIASALEWLEKALDPYKAPEMKEWCVLQAVHNLKGEPEDP